MDKAPEETTKNSSPHLLASFQPLLCSRTPAQELPRCDRTATVAQESTSPLCVTGNNSRAEILHFLDSRSSQLNWFKLYFVPCRQISITQTLKQKPLMFAKDYSHFLISQHSF